jgi:hypothetical protein
MNTILHILSIILICTHSLYALQNEATNHGVSITVTPAWLPIGHGKASTNEFGGAWICAGTISIRKRVNETLSLTEAAFKWNGGPLDKLHASLYRKNSEPFLAIEENLVSDGIWRPQQKMLTFSFDSKQILDPVTTFYLVLTVPPHLEQQLKKGSFELLVSHMPAELQPYLEHKSFLLSLSSLQQQKTTLALARR